MAAAVEEEEKLGTVVRTFARDCLTRLWAFLALPPGKGRLPMVIAWAAGLASLVAIVHRFRFGADLTDESFALAMPYRFALGDRPFVDEISIQQTSALVLTPFVWLFVKITRGSTYLVLFVRMVHVFVFKGASAVCVHMAARRLLKHRASALAVAFVVFPFAPASIPNVGYNTIGFTLLTAATFLSFAGVAGDEPRYRTLATAGFLHAVMSLAYPTWVVAPLLATPLVLLCAPNHRLKATGAFIAGGLFLVLLVLPALRAGGVAGLRRSMSWGIHSQMTHTLDGVKLVVQQLYDRRPPHIDKAFVVVLIAGLVRSRMLTAIVVPAVTLYLTLWNREEAGAHYAGMHAVIYLGIFAAPMVMIARPDEQLFKAAALVLVPSFACAIVAGWTSTQGTEASHLGFHAAFVLFALCCVRALEQARVDGAFAITSPMTMTFMQVAFLWAYQYRDAPVPALTEQIADGPFKGIFTSQDRARAFAEMSKIQRAFDRPPGRVLVLYESTGYYMWFKMKPGAHCVWEMPYGDTDGIMQYWQPRTTGQGIVIRVKGTGAGVLDGKLFVPDRLLMETPHFSVYRDR